MIRVIVMAGVMLLAAQTYSLHAASPSFSCTGVTQADLIAICGNEKLSKTDRMTTEMFESARRVDRATTLSVARAFLKDRANCGSDENCILVTQTMALAAFGQIAGDIASVAHNVPAKPEWETAFSRRNFRLGMSLEQFRQAPHPDPVHSPNAYPVCSDEQRAERYEYSDVGLNSKALKSAGVVKCSFFWGSGAAYEIFSAGVVLGDINSNTNFFFLNPNGENARYLAWIETSGPSASFDVLLPSFRKAYGEPSSVRVEKWQNQMGAVFDSRVYEWRNDVSIIEFKEFGRTSHVFALEHRLKPLMQELHIRLRDQAIGAADRL